MAGFGFVLNPTSDGFPAELNISTVTAGTGFAAMDPWDFTPPSPSPVYATSHDTEGSAAASEAHYDNREISGSLRVYGTSAANLQTRLGELAKMISQINREGGVLKLTTPATTVCYFDLLPQTSGGVLFNNRYVASNRAEVDLKMTARPFWRGAEVDLGSQTETTLPCLIFTEASIAGDAPALGRLVVTDVNGFDQWQVDIGWQSRYYSSAATAALFYQAEDFTVAGTSTKVAGASGASGSGSNVVRNTDLTTSYQAVLRSEIDTSNLALTHKGSFRIKARLYRPAANTGAVTVALEWGEGDYLRRTVNDSVAYGVEDREAVFTWADLGLVHISPTSTQWEFRPLAKSTVTGDEIDFDCFILFPTGD